jgi:predicted metal-dependent hydrolase
MYPKNHQLIVEGLTVNVMRKPIRSFRLAISPPHGQVRVSAPLRVSDETIRLAILRKLEWIKYHQERLAKLPKPITPKFVSGEMHYFLGIAYPLNVVYGNGRRRAQLGNNHSIDLFIHEADDPAQRQLILSRWYRQQLKLQIPSLIERWEAVIGVKVAQWGVKLMRTRWGTCNARAKRIWLSLELAKKPLHCLDYVILHEMVHFLEQSHNQRFKTLMSHYLPEWKNYKSQLNQATC